MTSFGTPARKLRRLRDSTALAKGPRTPCAPLKTHTLTEMDL